MNKIRKAICFLLSFILLVQPGIPAHAKEKSENITVTYINPVYQHLVDSQDAVSVDSAENRGYSLVKSSAKAADYLTDDNKIAEIIREGMVKRADSITFYYKNTTGYDENDFRRWFELALGETDNPEEGDYLRWNYENVTADISYNTEDGVYYFEYVVKIKCYTTLAQEKEVSEKVDAVLKDLGVNNSSLSVYEKTKKIYDYICDNVTYDNKNASDDSYKLKHTAYAALIQKTAVCQGYAVLLYRMLEEAGIDSRVVFGVSKGENHTWNISELGTKYYLSDSTWDAGDEQYSYFLKGKNDFADHNTESAFVSEYNISDSNYDSTVHEHTEVITKGEKKVTCTENGHTAEISCSSCGIVLQESEVIVAEGHKFGEPSFGWEDDYWCIATFACEKCRTTEEIDCDITIDETPQTCTQEGVEVISASCEFEGKTYICPTTYTKKYGALGHSYVDGKCSRCKELQPESKIRFTEEMTNAAYTGEPVEIDKSIVEISEGNKKFRLEYYVDEECTIPTYYGDHDREWSAPTDTGVYYVKALAEQNDEYLLTETETPHKLVIRPRRVSSLAAANKASAIELTWKKRTEASGYIIYRKTDDTEYESIETIAGNSTLSFTDKNISQGEKYRYNIIAYKVDKEGEEVNSLKRATGTNIVRTKITSITNQDGSVKVKWTKVPDAVGYEVWRKASGYDSYGLLTNIKNGSTTSYTDKYAKSIRNGKASYYYVVPYYSESSNVVLKTNTKTNYYMTRPTLSSVATSGSGGLKVTWKKNSNASGYQIQYSTNSDMSDAKTVKITSRETLSKKISGLKKNKTYYVQVRAYKTYNDINYYSAWSLKKTKKTKS